MASLWNSAKHNRSTLTKTMRYWSPHVQGNQHRFWPWPAFVYPSWIMLSKKTSAASANIIYTVLMGFYTRIQFTQNNHKRNSNKLRKPDDNKKHKKQTNSKRTCLLQFSCSLVGFDCCFISDVLPISRRMLFEYSRFWCANDGTSI